jgi:hypothetical protein
MDDDFLEKYIRDQLQYSVKKQYVQKKDYKDAVNKYITSPGWHEKFDYIIPFEKEMALDELFGVNK